MPSISIGKVSDTETSITISASWDASAGGDTVYFQKDGEGAYTQSVSGTSGYNTHTFSGLSPSTNYFFEVAILDNNLDSTNDSASYTTDSSFTPASMYLGYKNVDHDSADILYKYVANDDPDLDYIKAYKDGNYYTTYNVSNTSFHDSYYTMSGLNGSTTYTVKGEFYSTSGYEGSDSVTFTTDAEPPPPNYAPNTPTLVHPTNGETIDENDQVSFQMYSDDPEGDDVEHYFQLSSDSGFSNILDSGYTGWKNSGETESVVPTVSFTAGNTYYWRAYARDGNGNSSSYSSAESFYIGKVRPSNWSWYNPKVSGEEFNLSHSEWLGFLSKINDFREYKGLSRYSFTDVQSGGNFRALHFNEAVNKINDMNPPTSTPSTVNTGDDVLASYFATLRDSLNSIQ